MIRTENLGKSFGARAIFKNVNLNFEDGKIYAFVGESGSGKTTLMRILSLLDNTYDGSLYIDYDDITTFNKKKTESYRLKNFSYIFSDSYLLEYLSIRENACLSKNLTFEPINQDELDKLIIYLKLDAIINNNVTELSAGEKQRVAILRALVSNRKYIIADEPTAHLDPINSKSILKLLKEITRELHKTIFVSLHDYTNLDIFDEVYQIKDLKITKL